MPPVQTKGQQTTWRWRTDPTITFENRSPCVRPLEGVQPKRKNV